MTTHPYFKEALALAHAQDLIAEARRRDRLSLAAQACCPATMATFVDRARNALAAATPGRRLFPSLRDFIGAPTPMQPRWATPSTAIARGSGGCG
jgi:hypothetical protein